MPNGPTRKGKLITDEQWKAVEHLPGRWELVGKKLVRLRTSRLSKSWIASVYELPINGVLDNGATVLGSWPTPEIALRAAANFLEVDPDAPKVCTLRDIDKVRKENRERAK